MQEREKLSEAPTGLRLTLGRPRHCPGMWSLWEAELLTTDEIVFPCPHVSGPSGAVQLRACSQQPPFQPTPLLPRLFSPVSRNLIP